MVLEELMPAFFLERLRFGSDRFLLLDVLAALLIKAIQRRLGVAGRPGQHGDDLSAYLVNVPFGALGLVVGPLIRGFALFQDRLVGRVAGKERTRRREDGQHGGRDGGIGGRAPLLRTGVAMLVLVAMMFDRSLNHFLRFQTFFHRVYLPSNYPRVPDDTAPVRVCDSWRSGR